MLSKIARQVILPLLCVLFIFIGNLPAYSATYYVAPNGSATWEQAKDIATPCSATTAMQNAQAGDVVYFRGGVYEVGQSVGYHGVLEPSNSGTITNPITFEAYPGETPIMNATVDDDKDNSRALGNGDRDYIIFDGFTLQANGGVKRGGMIITGANITGTPEGCQVLNCTFNGGTTICPTEDNRELLRLEGVDTTLVKGCKFFSCKSGRNYPEYPTGSNEAHAAILMYHVKGVIIENCEIYNCAGGIYAKSQTENNIYRYNYIHNCCEAIYVTTYSMGDIKRNADATKVYSNVIANNTYAGINFYPEGTAHANDCEVYNNTVYNSVRGICYAQNEADHGWKIYNNIVIDNNYDLWGNLSASLVKCDHNQYGTGLLSIYVRLYENGQLYTSLSSWQNSSELDDGGNPGYGSLASDPKFVNSSGNMNQLVDFQLLDDSPCKDAGCGGLDMGADISLVGIQNPSPPSAPPNFDLLN